MSFILKSICMGFVGILVWQIVCTIIYALTNEDDEFTLEVALFVPLFIISFVSFIVRKTYFSWCKKHLNAYVIHYLKDGKDYGRDIIYMTNELADKMNHHGESDYYIKKISDGSSFKSCPCKTDIYKGQDWFRGYDMRNYFWNNNS